MNCSAPCHESERARETVGESVFALLLHGIAALPEPCTREQVRELVLRFEGQRVYVPRAARRGQRIAHAARMLRRGLPRAEVVDALVDIYGMGRTAGYAIVNAALNLRRQPGELDASQRTTPRPDGHG